jgi:hypothetical protein
MPFPPKQLRNLRKKNLPFLIMVHNGIRKQLKQKEKCKANLPRTFSYSALYEDSCLYVVPRSHRRVRTPEERDITINDPKSHNMPDQLKVTLKPGQTVFYDNNILHRAAYFCANKRSTLHASMGTIEGGHHRAGVILQHGLDWMTTDGFKDSLPQSLHTPYNNLISMADKAGIANMQSKPIH